MRFLVVIVHRASIFPSALNTKPILTLLSKTTPSSTGGLQARPIDMEVEVHSVLQPSLSRCSVCGLRVRQGNVAKLPNIYQLCEAVVDGKGKVDTDDA